MHLPYFDGEDRAWYDGLDLPTRHEFVVGITVERYASRSQNKAAVYCAVFDARYTLSAYDVMVFILRAPLDTTRYQQVTAGTRRMYPQIFK